MSIVIIIAIPLVIGILAYLVIEDIRLNDDYNILDRNFSRAYKELIKSREKTYNFRTELYDLVLKLSENPDTFEVAKKLRSILWKYSAAKLK